MRLIEKTEEAEDWRIMNETDKDVTRHSSFKVHFSGGGGGGIRGRASRRFRFHQNQLFAKRVV